MTGIVELDFVKVIETIDNLERRYEYYCSALEEVISLLETGETGLILRGNDRPLASCGAELRQVLTQLKKNNGPKISGLCAMRDAALESGMEDESALDIFDFNAFTNP